MENKTLQALGNTIAWLRKEAGYSTGELASLAGVSRQTLWRFENGKGDSICYFHALCIALKKEPYKVLRHARRQCANAVVSGL